MNRKKLEKTYENFCFAEGNQHIASEYAIIKLQEIINSFKIKNVLEVGLGIGAIAGSLLEVNNDLVYTGTENNEFCLKALQQNLREDYKRLKLYNQITDLYQKGQFDLIIIDGKDVGIQLLNKCLSPQGIIAIEGDRRFQQEELRKLFPNHYFVHCTSGDKNKNYSPFSPEHWQGGIKVIFVNPSFKQKLWWGKEKLKSQLRYLLRIIKSR